MVSKGGVTKLSRVVMVETLVRATLDLLEVVGEEQDNKGDLVVTMRGQVELSRVLVETFWDFFDFTNFCFTNFAFSVFKEVISDLNFLTLLERFSHFWSSLYISVSFVFRDLLPRLRSFLVAAF